MDNKRGIISRGLAEKIIVEHHGFLMRIDIDAAAKENPFMLLLVRCGCGRFLCPAQDAGHFADIVTREGSDYVRDVTLPVEESRALRLHYGLREEVAV